MTFQLRCFNSCYKKLWKLKPWKEHVLEDITIRTSIKYFWSDQICLSIKKQPPVGNQLWHVLAFKDKGYLLKNISSSTRQTIAGFSKAFFPARNQQGTKATNSMWRLLSLGHTLFQIWSKQVGVINHWFRRQIDKSCPLIFSSIWILLMLISSISLTILAN